MPFPEHTVVMLAASSQPRSRSRTIFRAACVAACLLAAVALLSSTSSSSALNPVLESSPADVQLPVYHDVPGDVINSIEDRLDTLQAHDRKLKDKLARLQTAFDNFRPIPGPRGFPGNDGARCVF